MKEAFHETCAKTCMRRATSLVVPISWELSWEMDSFCAEVMDAMLLVMRSKRSWCCALESEVEAPVAAEHAPQPLAPLPPPPKAPDLKRATHARMMAMIARMMATAEKMRLERRTLAISCISAAPW